MSGKSEHGLGDDNNCSLACIADNVGDNVGGMARMGAVLFGSLADATYVALAAGSGLHKDYAPHACSVLVSSTGVVVGIVTLALGGVLFKVTSWAFWSLAPP